MRTNGPAADSPCVVVIRHDVTRPVRVYWIPHAPSLRRLQRMVGGYIERVPHWESMDGFPCNAWINEEGKLLHMPINTRATLVWYSKLGTRVQDYLVGDVILTVNYPDEV